MIHKKDNSVLERGEQLGRRKEFQPDFAIFNIFHNSNDNTTLSEGLCYDMQCLILLEDEFSHLNFKNVFYLGKEVAMSLGDTEIHKKITS